MAKQTIKIKSYTDIQEEYTATEAITPGMLVELASATTVQKMDDTAVVLPMVAVEDELQGNPITTNYSASNPVQCWIPRSGDKALLWLADGQSVTIGDFVESAGGGLVNKYTSNQAIGQVLETLDLSASANTANGRIIVRIL